VVDVGRVPGVWEQIRLVAGLRWRILRNGLRKKHNQWDLIGMIFAGVFATLFVLGVCFAFYFGAYSFLSGGHEAWIAFLFWAIFLFWQLVPIFTAGFGAGFEFRTLLRFPLSLRAFYVIGLAYGLSDFAAVASICWLTAMIIGAAAANPSVLASLLIVSVLFLLMNITLERMIGSWLERVLARRRSREIFFAVFILFAVSVQFLNPLLQRYGRSAQPWVEQLLPYLSVFPPSLAGQAIAGAAQNRYTDTLLGEAGIAFYALLFSVLLWMRFATQYRGEELSETAAPSRAVVRPVSRASEHSDGALRLLTPQVAAVLRKEFRYLTRNSFAFFLLIMPPVFVLLFTTQFAGRHPTATRHPVSTEFFFPGMMAYLLLILMAPAYNSFAYDGKGIQTFFTSPVSFREVFLGKNLLQTAMLAFELTLSMAAFSYLVGLPSPPVLMATLAAIIFNVAGQLTIANWSSLTFPRKLNFGQMRGQRQSGMAVLVSFGTQILLGGISAPILFISRWTGDKWLPAEVFAFLAAAAIAGYISSLDPLAALAEKKKETLVDALSR
jgi:ABC-2 type transport system permease protein